MDKKEKIKESLENNQGISVEENNMVDEAQKDLNTIIQLLTLNTISFDNELFKSKLKEYINKYHRILYSTISTIIFGLHNNSKDESIDNCIQNLTSLANGIHTGEAMLEEDKIIFKLLDHVLLANQQISSLEITEEKVNPYIQKSIEKIKDIINKEKENINKDIKVTVNNEKENITKDINTKIKENTEPIASQMISIVSIFVGIAFVMFGGLTLMNGLFHFDGSKRVPLIELICLASLVGIIMIVIMYSFIMFVLRIIGKYDSENSRVYIEVIKTACRILAIVSFAAFILWCLNTYVLFL